jgi:hypothetical protein
MGNKRLLRNKDALLRRIGQVTGQVTGQVEPISFQSYQQVYHWVAIERAQIAQQIGRKGNNGTNRICKGKGTLYWD